MTTACLSDDGSRPWASDALTILVRYGSSVFTNSRTMNVGTGSSEHDLTGDDITMRRICAGEHGWNDDLDDAARAVSSGGGNPAVAERTSSIFFVKNAAKLSAVRLVALVVLRSRPRIDDNERQRTDDERPH